MEEDHIIQTSVSYNFEDIENTERTNKNSFTIRIQPPEIPPHFEITFKFSCSETHSDWVTGRESFSPRWLRSIDTPREVKSTIRINLGTFLSPRRARKAIRRGLESWVPSGLWRRYLSEVAFRRAVEDVRSMPRSHNVVFIDLNVVADHERVFDEDRLLDFVARLSLEEGKRFMVPASDSSIEALEKRMASSDGECVVCFEEYSSGSEVMCMPCSLHFFHEDCIKEWLRVSHYCPVCRFEMPVMET